MAQRQKNQIWRQGEVLLQRGWICQGMQKWVVSPHKVGSVTTPSRSSASAIRATQSTQGCALATLQASLSFSIPSKKSPNFIFVQQASLVKVTALLVPALGALTGWAFLLHLQHHYLLLLPLLTVAQDVSKKWWICICFLDFLSLSWHTFDKKCRITSWRTF